MGARQHRQLGVLMRQSGDGVADLVEHRQQRLSACFAQHQGISQVVDILGGAGEVNELADCLQFGVAGDLFLEQVLDRLHVVVGGPLDILDPLGVSQGEMFEQPIENMAGMLAQSRHFGNAGLAGQRLQPADLDQHPMANQAILAEDRPQIGGLVGIAAIDGRNGG